MNDVANVIIGNVVNTAGGISVKLVSNANRTITNATVPYVNMRHKGLVVYTTRYNVQLELLLDH
ncbi:hypothetical protein BLOT_010682 [Blomia tropicalis]|nr:hypothetical protein BLOT_010682 [Blomia tropicalis]